MAHRLSPGEPRGSLRISRSGNRLLQGEREPCDKGEAGGKVDENTDRIDRNYLTQVKRPAKAANYPRSMTRAIFLSAVDAVGIGPCAGDNGNNIDRKKHLLITTFSALRAMRSVFSRVFAGVVGAP